MDDVHTRNARLLFKLADDQEPTKEQRNEAKRAAYRAIYGGGNEQGINMKIGEHVSLAQALLDAGINIFGAELLVESFERLVDSNPVACGPLEFIVRSRLDPTKQVRIRLSVEAHGTEPAVKLHTSGLLRNAEAQKQHVLPIGDV